jgi:hypothetical protein
VPVEAEAVAAEVVIGIHVKVKGMKGVDGLVLILPSRARLIQSVTQVFLMWLQAWDEVGGIDASQCPKAMLPQPITT